MFSGGMKRKFDDLSEESNGNNSTKGEGENENGKNSSSSSEFPANAWEQFTLGRNRYNQQIVICKKCGFDQTYSSLKDAIIQHLSKNCKEKIISIATKNEPVVLETKQDPIESPKVNEIIEIDLTSVASPVLPVITHATYYEELNEKLHNLQRFDVAKESRLQIPAQFRLKKETLEERARYNTNNNKMVRESSEYQSSNGNGSHADIDSVSSTTVGSSKHISNQLDRQYTFTSPWYSYVKSNISGCLASLKVLEMERNNLIVQENYSHALETWKWRQSLLLKRNENREFNIQSTRSYFQMPLVSRFSNSSIQKKVEVLDNDEEDEDMDTEDDREEVEEKKEKEKPIFAKSYLIRQLLPKCKGASYTKNASVKIIVDKKAFRCLQRINSICTNHNVVVSRKARFNTSFPKVSRNPASCFFIKIRENQVMEDQTTFRSLPYLGDDVRIDISEFNRIVGHVPGQIEPEVCGEAEELLVAYFISQGIVRSSSKSINFEQVHEKNVLPEILAALTSVLEVSTKEILRAYKVISESYWFRHGISENSSKSKVNSWAAIDLDKVGYCEPLLALTGFDEASFDIDDEHNLQTGVGIGLGVINSLRYNKMVANFRDFFCRRCYIMNCYDHSIQQPQPQKRIDPNPPFSSVFNKLLLPSDFIRFHRRSYFNSNRYLIENFPSIAEMERGNQTENMRPSLRSQETFINKLEYDSRSRTIKIKESKSSAGGIKTRTATLMKDMELFDWIESEEDWVDIRDLCRPCTPSLQGSSLDVKPRKMIKGHSPRHDSGLDDFQPIFKSTLDVRKVTPSITNVDHPILSNLDLSNMVEEKENPNPRSQKLKTSIDWSIDSTTNIPSTSSNAPYLSDDEVVLFINKAPRSNQAASAVQIIPGSSTDKSIIEVVSIPETTTTIDSSSVSESNQIRNRKYDFQQSFTPPLTDAELALIEKLCSVHKTLKPFMTPFDQRLPFEQYFQPKLMENHGGNVSNFAVNRMLNYETKQADKVPLVKFIAEVMQTRQTSEIVRIIQERDWLFLNLMNGDHNGSSDFSRNGITDSAISDTMMETEIEKMEFEFFPGADEEDDELVIFSVNHNKLNINTKNHSYQACGHLGPCTNDNKNCICVVYGNFCDKYCCCDRQCRRKFQGCNCQRGQCKTKACPCWAAGRACDPDLCGTCGVSLHPIYLKLLQSKLPSKPASENLNEKVASKSFNSNSVMKKLNSRDKLANFIDLSTDDLQEKASLDSKVLNTVKDIKQNLSNPSPIMNLDLDQSVTLKICNNLPFNLRTPKKICIKPSTIHGWGAFALEPIEKNEFVIEYRGELISQEEADRRGIIYDKLNLSYLFNINEETVIDATKKGNKAKFLNHSENPNCATRVLQMFGDHKVGIFAKRDINIGEELTFDYLYRKCVPTWAEKKTTTTNVSKNRKNSKSKSSSK